MNFSGTLEHLLDIASPLKPLALFSLSRLEPEEMERLTAIWSTIPITRRRALVKELVEITETNFEVDFERVFRWGLSDPDSEVRATSVEGLWENEELALLAEMLNMLQNDPSSHVRTAVALSLGRFILLFELGKLSPSHGQSAYEALRSLVTVDTEEIKIRRRALESIAYVSSNEIAGMLQAAYEHPDEKMRISGVFGMGRSADERWIDTVIGELFSTSPEMRYEAVRACGELQARAAVPKLAELIDDPDREVQEITLWALGQIGGDAARQLLQNCCQEGDSAIRSAAETALEELEFLYGHLDFPFYEFDKLDGVE